MDLISDLGSLEIIVFIITMKVMIYPHHVLIVLIHMLRGISFHLRVKYLLVKVILVMRFLIASVF